MSSASLRLQTNAQVVGPSGPCARELGLLDPTAAARARDIISQWPIYRPTPTIELRGLAGRLGVGALWVKDESQRLPLRSFKQVGAAYALAMAVSTHVPWLRLPMGQYYREEGLPTSAR